MAVDIMGAFETEPPELDFIWPGFISGAVGALVAPGATGKSFWALQAAMAVAAPGADLLDIRPPANGPVVYYAAEDPLPVLVRRLHSIGKHLPTDVRVAVAERLTLEAAMGRRMDLSDDAQLSGVVEYCQGARLIVFDTLSRFHTLDENNNGLMAGLVARMEYIAAETGSAVLYLHHTSKASALQGQGDMQQAARGASALIDNVRWCGFVSKMSRSESENLTSRTFDREPIGPDDRLWYVRFGASKENYGISEFGAERWYKRHEGGVLLPIALRSVEAQVKTRMKLINTDKEVQDDERW